MARSFVSLFQEKVEAFDNIERAYTTRVHQDDRRCWHVIRVCARVGRVASGNCDTDAYRCPKTFGAPHDPVQFLQQLALLVDEQFGVTDNVDEKDVADL
jgi:hypothetical protein